MTLRLSLFLFLLLNIMPFAASAQTPTPTPTPTPIPQPATFIGQVSNSGAESFAGAISGDGRFVVFESRGNLATENPRNQDGNVEIFLFDYAQRRIFQITDTKSVLWHQSLGFVTTNIRVEITNRRPTISHDGRWIAFSSNATSSTPTVPDSTHPGSFDGNTLTTGAATPTPTPSPTPAPTTTPTPNPGMNPLTADANLEMWLYEIPAYAPADLSTGEELPLTVLSGGNFVRVTNTPASRLPIGATSTTGAFVADDNHDAALSDSGDILAFGSTRNLVPAVGNTFPDNDNEEIFTYVRSSGLTNQVTRTPRGPIADPIYNKYPSISGDGTRVAFSSTGDDPIDNPAAEANFDTGSNPSTSRNEEIFYADLSGGSPTGGKQVTTTTPTNPGEVVNVLDFGKRMSRDGRFIGFDSYADLANEHSGANQTSFALYVFDATLTTNPFRRIGPRSTADAAANGGDVQHYPGFTDYDPAGTPRTLLLQTRQNIKPDGTIPTTASEGLNPVDLRPTQIYAYQLDQPPATAVFNRLTKFPISTAFLASTQPLPSETSVRMAFNLALTELGTGNPDLSSESFYLLKPVVTGEAAATFNFATGASRRPVVFATPSPTPTPSPTATPTPTPTPSPTPTPGGSPSPTPTPSPSPTPVTPPSVFGLSQGMLAILNYESTANPPVVARTAVGSISRRFQLPIELSGVRLAINGVAAGIQSVSQGEIFFVVPPAMSGAPAGTEYPFVLNNNGVEYRGNLKLVPARPDIFTTLPTPGPFGRALVTNVTNRVHTTEPFTVTTIMIRGGRRVPTRLRLRVTGMVNVNPALITVRIGSVEIAGANIRTGGILEAPGVYTIDFDLPPSLNEAGDQPIIVTINAEGGPYQSRLDDTAPRIFIL